MKNYKYFTSITVFFVVVLIISNIVSTKIINIWWFTFDWWTIIFPLSYIFGDILTEVYWYKKTKKIIRLWFISSLLMSFIIYLVWMLPADPSWWLQNEYQAILWYVPRIVLASLIAYIWWEFSNSYIIAKLKILTKWKKLWVRLIGSTIIWQLIDTVLFVLIAFYWTFDNNLLLVIIISNYIFKIWIEIFFSPLTCHIVNKLKNIEKEDYYDNNTDFNPLKFQ
jgi:uncharacterized integral membrane protein (TIGR00697 family)